MQTGLSVDTITGSSIGRAGAPANRSERRIETPGLARVYRKDTEIFAEGERAAYFYKVVSGAVRTYKLLSDGRRQIADFHLPGDVFGIEFMDERRFSAEAVTDAAVIVYRCCRPETLMTSDNPFGAFIIAAIMRGLERAHEHILLLGRKSALEKVAAFLLDLFERVSEGGSMDLPMGRSDIADYLGLTIETVSRTLTHLEREAVIQLPASRYIVLRNRAALLKLNS